MEKVKNYFKGFGLWEWIIAIGGTLVFAKQIYSYLIGTQELTWPHLVVFIISLVAMRFPVYLTQKAKQGSNYLTKKLKDNIK